MDLDLGELGVLRKFILPSALWTDSPDQDATMTVIGKGMAALFDQYCNRKFKRNTAHVDTFTADRDHWFLAASPVESITSVELKTNETDGYVTQGTGFINLHEATGRCYFGFQHGAEDTLVRVTYSGGYWFDSSDNQQGTIPAGATQLPYDIHMAWLMQCQYAWSLKDKTGIALSSKPGEADKTGDLTLAPAVQRILNGYIRYQMT